MNATIEERRRLLALAIASDIEDSSSSDIADFLESFVPIPTKDPELEQYEKDHFIVPMGPDDVTPVDHFEVYMPDNLYDFPTLDDAYAFICEHYEELKSMYPEAKL